MAVIETLTLRTPGYPQPTRNVDLDDADGTIANATIKWTDHTGAVVSVPLTLDNARKLFVACAEYGNPERRSSV